MSAYSARRYTFAPSPSVRAARARPRYVGCSVCGEARAEYLFFRAGVRFVRCSSCGLVYVSPVGGAGPCYFDVAEVGRLVTPRDLASARADLARLIGSLCAEHRARRSTSRLRVLLLGRWLDGLAEQPELDGVELEVARIQAAAFERLSVAGDVSWLLPSVAAADLVIANELLEACAEPASVLRQLARALSPRALLAITYADIDSTPARLLRRHWPAFFELKRAFFGLRQLLRLAEPLGLSLVAHRSALSHRSPRYAAERLIDAAPSLRGLARVAPSRPALPLATGVKVALFEAKPEVTGAERLSIIIPVYQEAATVRQVIDALLEKPLRVEKELIIVESGSRDGSREIVAEYAATPGVRVIHEPAPRGKGHAVRTGLAAASGSIILIQDADLEYDIDDYDALLEPILQRRASFVLGSRTLGAGDWKVRRFARGAIAAALLNVAQVGFARTFNLLYQQRTTDVNTMFKVFRRSCLEGVSLESDGFELDIELVCKLVRAGHAPLEVPVNYAARDFSQGKKIRFARDAWSGYSAFFKYRFR